MTAAEPITTIDRASGIGGTDAAAILGLSRNRTAFDVWARKKGLIPDTPPNKRMRFGKLLEQVIAKEYCAVLEHNCDNEVQYMVEWDDQTHRHERRAWQIWTPDAHRYSALRDAEPFRPDGIGLDAKNVAWDQAYLWGEQGSDEIPEWILVQCAYYMSAENIDRWDIAALFGGNDLRIYSVARDLDIEAVILERCEEFWRRYLVGGEEPELGIGEGARQYLRKRFPRVVLDIRAATAEELPLIEEYRRARAAFSAAEDRKETADNEIKLAIGPADGIEFAGGRITYREVKGCTYTVTKEPGRRLLAKFKEEK